MNGPSDNRFLLVLPWDLHHSGGVNEVVKNLASTLGSMGLVPPLLMNSQSGFDKVQVEEVQGGFTLARLTLRNPRSELTPLRGLISFFFHLPRTVRLFYRLLQKEKIGTINVHYPSLSSLAVMLVAKFISPKRKVLLSFHGADVAEIARSGKPWLLVWRALLSQVDAVVVCSSALAAELETVLPIARAKLKVIHNGVNCQRTIRDAGQGQVPRELHGKQILLNAATLEHKKGQDVLIRAFAKLADRFPNTRLVLMGRVAAAKPQLVELVTSLHLNKRVLILENVPHNDVLATMQQANICVLPSRKEPFGIVLLEAAVFSVPVVASRVGGITEIIEDNVSGLLVEPDDVDALASKMASILDGSVATDRLTQNLHNRLSYFTWRRAALEYANLAGEP